uniref:Uncharacterized protein n=1 Tax=Meloidogyne enterolobii TaxID=390850 RepID=A0A6V7UCX1_MELEN|nr:unnamed protein product [Meloidogyne enterolobii]
MTKVIFVFFLLAFLTFVVSEKAHGKRKLTAQDCKNIQGPYVIQICTKNGQVDYDCIDKNCPTCCKKHG